MERRTLPLTVETMRGMLPRGGTVLGTRRGSPFDHPDGVERVGDTLRDMGLDGLIVIGGNGSLSVACKLHAEHELPIVGVPKTIDNDIEGTDVTFGFNTAVQIATDAIDRLHTTAESHDRVLVVEVMGRHSGWIATYAGIAGGAAVVLIPERPFDIEEVCDRIIRRHQRGRFASIVVVAEGALPEGGLGRARRPRGRPLRPHPARVASATWSPRRSAPAPGSRPARCCSATSSAAARPPRSTACCPPGSASPRSTPCTPARGATWWRSAADKIVHTPLTDVVGTHPPGRHVAVRERRRGLLRLTGRAGPTGGWLRRPTAPTGTRAAPTAPCRGSRTRAAAGRWRRGRRSATRSLAARSVICTDSTPSISLAVYTIWASGLHERRPAQRR